MFRSLFGKGKKGRSSDTGSSQPDESIRSAGVADVVVIAGFSPTFEDAYFIIEAVSRYESAFGKWHELIGVEGDRRVAIDWSDGDGLFISVSEQEEAMGLGSVGLNDDEMVRLDESHSIDNFINYEGEAYYYRNSYEVYYFKDNSGEGEGFYTWDFSNEDRKRMISVVKWEGIPFEVYASVAVSPNTVSVYKK